MSHRVHLALMFLGEFAGFFAAAIVSIWLWVARPYPLSTPVLILVMGGLILACVMIPRTIFRRLVPARCPVEGCGGAAFPRGSKPIVYQCRRCDHTIDTGWSEGSSRHHHRP